MKLVLAKLDIDTSLITPRTPTQVSVPCPLAPYFHKSKTDNHPSLSIKFGEPPTVFKCFSCHESGRLHDLVDSYSTLAKKPELQSLADSLRETDKVTVESQLTNVGGGLDSYTADRKASAPRTLKPSILDGFIPISESRQAHDYLTKREVDATTVARFNLLFDDRNKRIIFPTYDRRGNLTGAVGRDAYEGGGRYYNYFGIETGKTLGGINHVDDSNEFVFVVEGYFDLLRAWRWAIEHKADLVCTFHAECTEHQARHVLALSKPVWFWYDMDIAADRGWDKSKRLLEHSPTKVRRVKWADKALDVGAMSKAQFDQLVFYWKEKFYV